MSEGTPMETSALTWAITRDPTLLQRVEALVRIDRWTGEDDTVLGRPVPVDQLLWAVATDTDIRDGVEGRLDGQQPDVAAACAGITDTELHPVVTAALGRLA